MEPIWRSALQHLEDHFDGPTLSRGRPYAADGSIADLAVIEQDDHYLEVAALAYGAAPWPYEVLLVAQDHRGRVGLVTECTCPVGTRCKHGAALAMRLRDQLVTTDDTAADRRPGPPGIDVLLADLAPLMPADHDQTPLGLEFSLAPLRGPVGGTGAPLRLQVRPMRPGKQKAWVRSGATWGDLRMPERAAAYDTEQVRALSPLVDALTLQRQGWQAGLGDPADLARFGPGAVARLRAAVAAGVVLIGGPGVAEVCLWPEPVALTADARQVGGVTEITIGLDLDGRLLAGPSVMTYGEPAHTASAPDGDDEGRFLILSLEPTLAPGPRRALGSSDPVVLPDATADRLRHLARALPVGSSDGSVDLPGRLTPALRVRVAWRTAAEADVDWEWCYGDHPPFPIDGRGSDVPGAVDRDRTAERALLTSLDPSPTTGHRHVDGADTLHLALLELPAWRETAERVEELTVLESDAPEFREADEGPEISFATADPAPDHEAAPGADTGAVDWLDLHVAITVEGEPVPLATVVEALTLRSDHLLLPSGLYVSTARPEFGRLHDVVRAAGLLRDRRRRGAPPPQDGRVRVGRDDLGLLAEIADLGPVDTAAAAWVDRALALRDLVTLPTPEPRGVVSSLRPYQLDGFHWLAFLHRHGLGGILADDMGLGKTLQVLTLIAGARASGAGARSADADAGARSAGAGPFLVVAPTSVVSNWAREADRHTPGLVVRTVTASGVRRTESIATLAEGADIVVTSYTLLRLESADYAALPWGGLILDEAQQVKNHQSKAHGAVRAISAPFRLAVTGTPFENRLLELWSLLSIVAPGLYPDARTFTEHVVRPVEKEGDSAALRRFTRRIRPFVLRRTKEVVAADLPPKQEQVLTVDLTPGHRKLYDAHLAKERQRILGLVEDDFDRNRVAILAALTTLRQLSLDPALIDPDRDHLGSAKLDVLVDHLRDIAAEGHRALVFSSFTGFLARVRARLTQEGITVAYLDGATRDRAAAVEGFRAGDAAAFLISLKAGGTGLTLTEADYVFVLDPWWNPAAEAQAVDRAHRIGQQRTVMVYRLVSADTIEEKVMALKARKAALFAQVVDGEAGLTGSITASDIRDLFD